MDLIANLLRQIKDLDQSFDAGEVSDEEYRVEIDDLTTQLHLAPDYEE